MLGAAALIAALVAFLLYRVLKRRRSDSADDVFDESGRPKDTFFDIRSDEQTPANEHSAPAASSLSYSPNQLDSSEVDPVAEADVYLAYGRDLQAEEILREAMRTHPERVAVPLKLLEIHAKHRDLHAFEALTSDIHKLTGGTGPEWAHAVELGRELDPANALYQPDAVHAVASPVSMPESLTSISPVELEATPLPAFAHAMVPLDFNLDMPNDFPHDAISTPHTTAVVEDASDTVPRPLQIIQSTEAGFEFNMDWLSKYHIRGGSDAQPSDLDATEDAGERPHAMKLSLARELHAIGDTEGARSLIQEVASEGPEELQTKARQLLTQLST